MPGVKRLEGVRTCVETRLRRRIAGDKLVEVQVQKEEGVVQECLGVEGRNPGP